MNYTYDGDGNRLEKVSQKIYWYGAGTEILDESDASGNFTNEYVFFGGKRVAMRNVSSGTIYYYEDDMLGSARTMVQAGQTSLCYDADFYPFGGERDITTCGSNYKFEGKERDTETGNDDFGARYYTSRLGRWLSADWSSVPAPVPYANLTNPQTLNLYAMVSDNPETFADLDGHLIPGGPYNLEGGDWADVPQGINSDSNDAKAKKKQKNASAHVNGNDTDKAQQQNSTQQLTNAQDTARNDPKNAPQGGKTFCNIATCQIAKAMGAPTGALTNPKNGQPALANQIAANLGKSGSGYRQVSPQEAQQLANQGKLVIAAQPHAGHGHVATVRPGGSGSNPLINNIGAHVNVVPASRAFYSSPAVKYYTPQ